MTAKAPKAPPPTKDTDLRLFACAMARAGLAAARHEMFAAARLSVDSGLRHEDVAAACGISRATLFRALAAGDGLPK